MSDTYIDPHSGWMYGFPKEFPDGVEDVNAWLVENGYPQWEVDLWGDKQVPCSFTTKESE